MALLSSHLSQISQCADSISALPFEGPKIFTNALLAPHDITALIRDTEAHERALFHLAPPPLPRAPGGQDFAASFSSSTASAAARRGTVYSSKAPRRNTAVAAVLGGDLYQKTRRGEAERSGRPAKEKGEVDVEVLLEGAEKLCAVYAVPGAADRIAQLRRRHQQLSANIAHYENRVALQTRELERMNRPADFDEAEADLGGEEPVLESVRVAPVDLQREQEELEELERKKKALEERVSGMEKDLGGLMR